jgi:vacuolar protein sorting-associated protein 13A/C
MDIDFREPSSNKRRRLPRDGREGLIFMLKDREMQITIRYPGSNNPWSSPFNINDLGKVYIRLYRADGEMILVRAEILLEGATIFISLYQETGKWPYQIRNYTGVPVKVYQRPPDLDDHHFESEEYHRRFTTKQYIIPPGSMMDYAWDYPSLPIKFLVLNVSHREREIDLQAIGPLVPIKYPVGRSLVCTLYIWLTLIRNLAAKVSCRLI